ncbi:hypothetical protein ACFL6E_07035 [Candidatus Neomarinimicrobiota bacterium]
MTVLERDNTMNVMKIAVGFGVAVIFPMLVHYGVSTFSPPPEWSDYQMPEWELLDESATIEERQLLDAERKAIQELWEQKSITFAKHLFWVAVPIGLAGLIVGSMLNVPTIGIGLIFGAIFTLIDAYGSYWDNLPHGLRFVSLLIAFAALVIIGYRQFATKDSS